MTIPILYRALALLVVAAVGTAAVLIARNRGDAPAEPADAAAVAALEARVVEMEEQLAAGDVFAEELSDQVASLRQRLERRVSDLRASLRDLRGALRDARANAGTASQRADEASARADRALARAEAVTRDMRVLEDRFDDHQRRHHGGG